MKYSQLVLLISILSLAASQVCYKKYDAKWQHCCNFDELGGCFSQKTLQEVSATCNSNPKCEGFSFPHGADLGDGCYKFKCNNPCVEGFGEGSHDGYQCNAYVFQRNGKDEACFRKYFGKWEHCCNFDGLGGCFDGKSLQDVLGTCGATDGCEGLSYPVDQTVGGGGCYKTNCDKCQAGFGEGSHDGWACESVQFGIVASAKAASDQVAQQSSPKKKCVEFYNQCHYEGDKKLLCEGDPYINMGKDFGKVKSIRTNGLQVEVYQKKDVQGDFQEYVEDVECLE